MAQIVTAQFVGQTSCGFVSKKYYEIEISAGRSGCLCVRDVQGQGFTVTPEINAFIEAAVKELDLAEKNAIGEIGKIFSDAEQTPQN